MQAGADVVITMGCAEHLELGAEPHRYLDWGVADPAGMDLDGVREVRNDIARRVHALMAELDTPARA